MTISRKLVLTLLAVSAAPLLVALFTVNQLVVQQTERLVGARLQDNVDQTSRAIDQFMLDSLRNMKDFTTDAVEFNGDVADMSKKLRLLTYSYPSFSDILLVDANQRVVAATNESLIGQKDFVLRENLSDEFEMAVKDHYDQVYVCDSRGDKPIVPAEGNLGENVSHEVPIQMVAAVHDERGRLVGVLIGRIVVAGIEELVGDLNRRTPGGIAATLVDPDGRVLVSTRPDRKLLSHLSEFSDRAFKGRLAAGRIGWAKHENESKTLVMTGYAPTLEYGANKAGGWRLVTDASYATIMTPVKSTVARLLESFGILLIIAAGIGILIARNLSQPLLKLSEAAKTLSSGDYSVRVTNKHKDEMGLLGETFNRMAEQVESDRETVQREMEEKRKAVENLTVAKEEAERANMAKNEFLSHMSHELRTPLNAVIGFAQLLQMQSDDPDTNESAQSILKGGRHLLDLVNEVLDLSRIESGRMTLSVEPVDLSSVLTQAIELVGPIVRDRKLTLTVAEETFDEAFVHADRQRLVQVLLNLITNAAKYNRPQGRIDIRCVPGPSDGTLRVEIKDTGHGIRESDHHQLFQPFERLGETGTDGTGLGLALSRRLVRLMDGDLNLLYTGESGSTFALDLKSTSVPEHLEESLATLESLEGDTVSRKLRIVYIEDNVTNLQLLEKVFENSGGVELIPAMQARMGIQLVEHHLPDVVLLDLHLPDSSGLEVLQTLQANPATAHIPVVVISADATQHQVKTLLEAGAKSYLTKPIDLDALLTELSGIQLQP